MQDESETGEKGGKKPHRAFPTVIFSVSATTTGYSEPNRGRGQPRSENAGDAEADDEVQTREEGNELSVETDGTSMLDGDDEELRMQMREMGLPCNFASREVDGEEGGKRKRKAKERRSGGEPWTGARTRTFWRAADLSVHLFRTRVRAAMAAADVEGGGGGGGGGGGVGVGEQQWMYSTGEEEGLYGPFSVLEMLVWVSAGYFLGPESNVKLVSVSSETAERGPLIPVPRVRDLVALLVVGRDRPKRIGVGEGEGEGEREGSVAALRAAVEEEELRSRACYPPTLAAYA